MLADHWPSQKADYSGNSMADHLCCFYWVFIFWCFLWWIHCLWLGSGHLFSGPSCYFSVAWKKTSSVGLSWLPCFMSMRNCVLHGETYMLDECIMHCQPPNRLMSLKIFSPCRWKLELKIAFTSSSSTIKASKLWFWSAILYLWFMILLIRHLLVTSFPIEYRNLKKGKEKECGSPMCSGSTGL